MIQLLQQAFMASGAFVFVGLLALLWGFLFLVIGDEIIAIFKQFFQSRKDDHMFNQVEEFRRDFS